MIKHPLLYAVTAAFLFITGCSQSDTQFSRHGIGTELGYAGLPSQTQLQDEYVRHICRQAGSAGCSLDWNTFVQAGLNDIDQRCDAYLAWLDERRRTKGPILQQIGDTQSATDAILLATKVSSVAIGIVGTAFGFARDTFNNVNSSLLLEVNHSTVQAIVLSNQTRFRTELRGKSVSTRPEALYALRQYLRICMPFTIETEINNTLTTLASGGPQALEDSDPLIATDVIGAPVAPRMIVVPRKYAPEPPPSGYALILSNPGNGLGAAYVRRVLGKLCVPPDEIEHVSARTKARILAYQQWRQALAGDKTTKLTGRLTDRELTLANSEAQCDSARFANYYEEVTFPSGINDPGLVEMMNVLLGAGRKLTEGATQADVRSRIVELRSSLAGDLALKDPELVNQLTWDLVQAITKRAQNGL
ncbi:hypothetical protein [Mesorhizobium sp. CA7]|uniref:hypothetical protein n=1 Tax=Mesorhizobium sp. CA7 TaxID=588501 RepID=UPI001CCE5B91|nr:hypothetical protein [Mesorhizobium sp. CA7]MBZ9814755.1 hypothetical protein [Mesorhizobium sp. CA7]